MAVEKSFDVDLDAPPTEVMPLIDDLGSYPRWMPLVHVVDREDEATWRVELRAKVGPFARSKRLRMRRTHRSPTEVVFERDEGDGRRHSTWVLRGEVRAVEGGTTVRMNLRYGGALWAPILDRVLADQVEMGRAGLRALFDGRAG